MSNALIGKKIGMTQVYDESNTLVPVTVIEVGPCPVVQIKTQEVDGYDAIQIGYGIKKAKNESKAQIKRFEKAGVAPQRTLAEVRGKYDDVEVGQVLTVDLFSETKKVDVIGTTKGRGFQGVVKRWNFAGGPASHGSMFHRRGGSFGMCQWPGRVIKGKKMPGRFGGDQRTVQSLKVVSVIPEKNLLLVKGSIPGAKGSEVMVRKAIKTK